MREKKNEVRGGGEVWSFHSYGWVGEEKDCGVMNLVKNEVWEGEFTVENEVWGWLWLRVLWEVQEGELEKTEVDLEDKGSEVDLEETVVAIESPF